MKDVTKLGNIADIYDGPHATPKKIENGKYFLSISSLDNGSLDLSKSAFISDKDFIKWTKRVQPQKGDLLFSYETRLGEAALMPDNLQACLGRRMGLLRPKKDKVIPQYLLFAYLSPEFQKVIRKNTIKGATVDRIALNELGNFPIYIPDLKTQQSIAAVLSALDKKIALNKQINARLEQMAKTLYDYWFVQFDFPDANGKPYKSSGGEMVFDETLKREIPKGWKSGNILNIANLLGGGTPSKSSPKYWNGNIPFFTPTDCDNSIFILDTADRITDAGLCNSSTRLFKKHSIFITARGSVGRSSINAVPMAMNQSCYAFQAKENVSYTFLFFLIRELIMILEVKATGSVFNSIVSSDIETTNLVISNKDLIRKFGEYCEPLFNQIETNLKQNHQLTQLRDFLLPMLMNGQVSVAE